MFDKMRDVLNYLYAQQRFIDSGFDQTMEAIDTRHMTGLLDNRPDPGIRGRIYFARDLGANGTLFWDNGTAWKQIDADA